mgnify:CR=1 FL=1|jgi:nicotinamidase/pyrazinamidase
MDPGALRDGDALLVVDVQYDFLPGGALGVAGGDAVVDPIAALAPRFHTVVLTQDFHPPGHISFASAHPGTRPYDVIQLPGGSQALWPDHCVAGTRGATLHERIRDPSFDRHVTLVYRKGTHRDVDSYSALRENAYLPGHRRTTGLGEWLRARRVDRLFLAGLARDYCVAWTALDARAQGFEVIVIEACTRPVFPDRIAATDAEFERAGVRVVPAL